MFWTIVFLSTLFPIVTLPVLLAYDRWRRFNAPIPLPDRKRKTMNGVMVLLFTFMIGLSQVPASNAQAINGQPVSTFLSAQGPGMNGQPWKVVTVELAPGAVDSRSIRPGTGLLYVLDGGGLLELDGKATIGLRPGIAAALNPERPHVLKNTSETGTLRVLVVSFQETSPRLTKH